MPPFVPRKRVSSEDPPSAKRHHAIPAVESPVVEDSEDESSLSDAPVSDNGETPDSNDGTQKSKGKSQGSDDEDDDGDDEVDWEDAIDTTAQTANTTALLPSAIESQELELTLDKNEVHVADLLDGKKGPTKIERQIRIRTHCLHVQLLLAHNAVRNAWTNDTKVHETLRRRLPTGIHKEIKKWRIASGLDPPETEAPEKFTKKKKGKGKQTRDSERDWGEGSSRLEPGQPDMGFGDPIITLLKILAAYWKKQFKITAPGLRKHGYQHVSQLDAEIRSFHNDDHDPERHGERFASVDEFRSAAERMEGSRDTAAQLFTAMLRALGIEARLVASLQPLGFGWTKAETHTPKSKAESSKIGPENAEEAELDEGEEAGSSSDSPGKNSSSRRKDDNRGYDRDLPFPIYWTEVVSPLTHQIIPVDPIVLKNPVATTPDLQAAFEPRGAKAEKAKQVICYVIAYSPDKSAKDVTTRYLRRRTWPGKTKGYRMPVEKIPIPGKKGKFFEYDWFRVIFRIYQRPQRSIVDHVEDHQDLVPNQPEKKPAKEGDTLQSLRASTEFVLERFLRREEALRPGSKPVRTFTTGKGAKAKEEDVYRRADVVKCLSAESWHKEGRQIKFGEAPLKRVPIRAVTLLRKREVDELERETGEKPKQGLYAKCQTEYIIPPPIQNGVIPKNDYGNIDCFVPSMVPRGAVHIPWPGTVRICKKLGIDYAEAVTGFEFGSKMAVPVIQGVVVAEENEGLVTDAWMADEAEKRKKEQLKAEKRILQTWRKFLFGLRIADRVREEYGGAMAKDHEEDEVNPFARGQARSGPRKREEEPLHEESEGEGEEDPADRGGGFLLPGEDDGDDGGLVVERHEQETRPPSESQAIEISDDDEEKEDDGNEEDNDESAGVDDEDSSSNEELSPPPAELSETDKEEYRPRTRRQTRSRRGGG